MPSGPKRELDEYKVFSEENYPGRYGICENGVVMYIRFSIGCTMREKCEKRSISEPSDRRWISRNLPALTSCAGNLRPFPAKYTRGMTDFPQFEYETAGLPPSHCIRGAAFYFVQLFPKCHGAFLAPYSILMFVQHPDSTARLYDIT